MIEPSENDLNLFACAIELAEADRELFVRTTAGDAAQARSVLRLLKLSERECFLDRSPAEVFPSLLIPEGFADIGFEVIRELGRGGMGVVYLAEDVNLKRHVALKVMTADAVLSRNASKRLRTEAQAAARLDHPGIVPVYQSGSLGEVFYIVSAYIEGSTLADLLNDRANAASRAPAWQWKSAGIVAEIARAVEYAHREGVLHRDLKPANILIDLNGRPFLADFGIAKLLDEVGSLTETGEAPGSFAYMSPEQLGLASGAAGPSSDVYALGAVLFECLTGCAFRDASDATEASTDQEKSLAALDELAAGRTPRALVLVCRRALAWDPAQRYQTAAEMASDLEAAARGELRVSRMSLSPLRRFVRVHKKLSAAFLVVSAAIAVTVALSTLNTDPAGTVQIRGDARNLHGAEVWARAIDQMDRIPGESVSLGQLPLRRQLAPGLYRFIVADPASEYPREFTRRVHVNEETTLEIGPLSGAPMTEQMVYIPGGVIEVGDGSANPELMKRPLDIEPFFIDQSEVTNATYRSFVLATERRPAPLWPEPYDESWDPLPVVGVTLADARSYAEWRGVRLPTDIEWEYAAAGPDGNPYPWSSDQTEAALASFGPGTTEIRPGDELDRVRHTAIYLALCQPSGSSAFDRTSTGLVDMFGNVAEWTESEGTTPFAAHVFSIIKGFAWTDSRPQLRDLQSLMMSEPGVVSSRFGFRCAMSAPAEQ